MKNKLLGILLTLVLLFTLIPVYALADNYNVVVSVNNNQVMISGGNSSYVGKDLTLRVVDQDNVNILVDQLKAGTDGNYSFGPFALGNGNYTAYVGGVNSPESKTFTVYSQQPPVETGSTNANLTALLLSAASLDFSADKTEYAISVGNSVSNLTVTASTEDTNATVKINSEATTSKQVDLIEGSNSIVIEVTAQDGKTKKTYNLSIKRPATQVVVPNVPIQVSTEPLSISVPAGSTNATLQVTTVIVGTTRQATLPLIEVKADTSLGNVSVSIPAGTKITAPANWDGVIKLPEVQSNSSVSVSSGEVSAVIEVGSANVTLTFDKAVRLLVPNQAGKAAGYIKENVFTPITATISADTQAAADSEISTAGDAKIDVGSDQAIWTKHFTKFASYTAVTPVTPPTTNGSSSSGGGGGGSPLNSDIVFTSGGTLNLNGTTIVVPEGAFTSDIRVTVDKVIDTSTLPTDSLLKLVSEVFEIKKDKTGEFSKSVLISLPFNKTLVDLDTSSVAVYWLNEETNKWIQLDNTQIDKDNSTVTGSVNHFTKFAVLAAKQTVAPTPVASSTDLSDIKGHWAETSIREMIQKGSINGYLDGTFKPNNNITRAEFVSIIVKAFNIKEQDGKIFADTSNHWAKKSIAAAATQGIIDGYSDTSFGPDDTISREQMAAIIVRAAQINLVTEGTTYTDNSAISEWAKAAIATVTSNGLMNGYQDGTLNPKGNTTRAEAATVILRALPLKK